jgi:RNA 2',3'-cyclic 3'-phosphodiesterase
MSGGHTARLFVAIDPPARVREALATWARAAASTLSSDATGDARGALRLLDADSLHLTLCFLGNRPVGEIDLIAAAIADQQQEQSPLLCVGAPLSLPPRRPRLLAVEVHDSTSEESALAQLQRSVARSIADAVEWQPERRRFRGHITVARVRSGPRGGRSSSLEAARLPPTPQCTFNPPSVVLYRSWLAPAGAAYEAIASRTLSLSLDPPITG